MTTTDQPASTHDVTIAETPRWNATRQAFTVTCSCGLSFPVGTRKGADKLRTLHLAETQS